MEEKLSKIQWEMSSHDDPLAIDYTITTSGMKDIYVRLLANVKPIDYYDFFLTSNVLRYSTEQTNLYIQVSLSSDSSAGSRNHLWTLTTIDDMLEFLALHIYLSSHLVGTLRSNRKYFPM